VAEWQYPRSIRGMLEGENMNDCIIWEGKTWSNGRYGVVKIKGVFR
jgi:hypothetical protein